MAEWLIEKGIGEDRALALDGGAIVAARLDWPGTLAAGEIADGVLVTRAAGSFRGTLRFPGGEEALVDGLPRAACEGATLRAIVTRGAIAERGRDKLAQARLTDKPPRPAPSLAERLALSGASVRTVRRFPVEGWDELMSEAWDGIVDFPQGSLTISATPAMTLMDIDGTASPPALSLAAVPAIAGAIRRFDLAGSIGVDFPTLADKSDRKAVDEALAAALDDWPHQRTAMNGFGFIQLVARLERPSLIHRIAQDRAGAGARLLLRRAERVTQPGALLLTGHPRVLSAIGDDWRGELARRTGRVLRWEPNAALALHAGYAQAVAL